MKTPLANNEESLRLVLVFQHAVFEDILRELIRLRWKEGNTDWVSTLPIEEIDGRQTKFTLGELAKLEGNKTIEEL